MEEVEIDEVGLLLELLGELKSAVPRASACTRKADGGMSIPDVSIPPEGNADPVSAPSWSVRVKGTRVGLVQGLRIQP